jgi:hypothetical protein
VNDTLELGAASSPDEGPVFALRPEYPDFLNLPWARSIEEWHECCDRLVQLPRGLSRHPVIFVQYDGRVYALKELAPGAAGREYDALRIMEELHLPVVTPVGHIETMTTAGAASVLITRHLDYSMPYHTLFMRSSLARYRDHLLDAVSSLLVRLHLAGVYWGDCSLSNVLFRRDAGTLSAWFVDAETSEIRPTLSDGLRANDLEIMRENVAGGLADLAAAGVLVVDRPVAEIGAYISQRYEELWQEINREVTIAPDERFRIQERVRALNALGFSVDEVELRPVEDGRRLRMRVVVTDKSFHGDLLHSLTGLDAQEKQAREMINEIQQLRATISEGKREPEPLSVAAYLWLNEVYLPAIEELRPLTDSTIDEIELYCQLLEHKWILSERDQKDVGHAAAARDLLLARRSLSS